MARMSHAPARTCMQARSVHCTSLWRTRPGVRAGQGVPSQGCLTASIFRAPQLRAAVVPASNHVPWQVSVHPLPPGAPILV